MKLVLEKISPHRAIRPPSHENSKKETPLLSANHNGWGMEMNITMPDHRRKKPTMKAPRFS